MSAAAPAVSAPAPEPPPRLTWLEMRCPRCGRHSFVILERCLRFGFPPCRRLTCGSDMAILGQLRAPVARNAEGLP